MAASARESSCERKTSFSGLRAYPMCHTAQTPQAQADNVSNCVTGKPDTDRAKCLNNPSIWRELWT